jgi:amino acid adenylation domain-containing protein
MLESAGYFDLDSGFAAGRMMEAVQSVEATITAELTGYAKANGWSLETLVLASWAHLLGCYAAESRVRIWRCPANSISELLPTLIPVALSSGDVETVQCWLARVSTELLTPNVHSREFSSPLDSVVLTEVLAPSALEKVIRTIDSKILLQAIDGPELRLSISCGSDRFTFAFLQILADCLAFILAQLVSLSSEPVAEIQLVPHTVRDRYLSPLSESLAEYPPVCVHRLIEEQCRRTPKGIAASFRNERITYFELNERANQLGRYLSRRGAGPDVIVAVHLSRSIDLLIAILGILKSGAAFLPLDVSLPAGRLQTVLLDSRATIVVTSSGLAERFPESNAGIVLIDAEKIAWQSERSDEFDPGTRNYNLAYVTYTSGSTGRPKGVMIEHRNVVASFTGMNQVLGETPGVWLAISNISFDIAVTELLWTLTRGFKVVLHEGDEGAPVVSGPNSVPEEMIAHSVTHLQGTPALMRMLLGHPLATNAFGGIRKLLVGGEAFPPALVSALKKVVSGDILNMYGPTEATICSVFHRVIGDAPLVPIGKPTANIRAYVVDRSRRLVPPLAPGELLLSGDGVGRGYVRNPDLTAAFFVRNPFIPGLNERMYRTGDIVRLSLGGTLEFLERCDDQVKLRGYRIELGEIEAALQAHPLIDRAAVVVREESSGEKTLAAFITGEAARETARIDLDSFLRKTLPAYMVPGVFIFVEKFPLTPTGKIDRLQLARSEAGYRISEVAARPSAPVRRQLRDHDDPLAGIESSVCSWLQELLALPQVLPSDDFFEIGGESLVAAELVQKIAKRYRVHLNLSVFLKSRTVRAIAECVLSEKNGKRLSWSPLINLRRGGSKPPVFLISGIEGRIIKFEPLSRLLEGDRPVYTIETQGLNRKYEVLSTIEDMAREYLREVFRVQREGPYHIVGYSFGGVIAFEMAHQLRSMRRQVGLLAMIDTPEWHYTQRVKAVLGVLKCLNIEYGGTIKRAVFGPDRKQALVTRWRDLLESCRISFERLARSRSQPSAAAAERRNLDALARYQPRIYTDLIHFFRCSDRSAYRGTDPLLGWGPYAPNLIVTEVPGEHGNVMMPPFVGLLGRELRNALDGAETQSRAVAGGCTSRRKDAFRDFGRRVPAQAGV